MRAMLRRPALLLSAILAIAACAPTRASAPPPAIGVSGTSGLLPGAGVPAAIPSLLNFVSLEGPLWVAPDHALLFSDVVENNGPGAAIYRYDPAQHSFSVFPYPTSVPPGPTSTNGLATDPRGALIACERTNARLVRIAPGGALTVLADRWPAGPSGQPLNAPNDVAVRADGNIYFSDTDWGARPKPSPAPMAVYRVSPTGALDRVLALDKPNGVALSPDGKTLYIGSDVQNKIWKLPLDEAGAAGAPELLIDGAQVPGGFKVPDGICIDDSGDLYVANNSDEIKAVVVFDPQGHALGRIPFPVAPSNCSFGGADRETLYVTTLHALYELRLPTPGLP